ncbi:hypothetical protein JCM4814A_82490 [Streptomyces phaeofaciens JCM 4814]|uniref:Uncharacterized protein n=1 Tax=Streptomyces phaeofaciens TaxID=68254 RepID=A0A918M055_9ACTN|nr:hypothetical protein GCM10010226_80490 [Streptomyces phaeofaciens]
MLGDALTAAGSVDSPTLWWHGSYGDRRWARATGAEHTISEHESGLESPVRGEVKVRPWTTAPTTRSVNWLDAQG